MVLMCCPQSHLKALLNFIGASRLMKVVQLARRVSSFIEKRASKERAKTLGQGRRRFNDPFNLHELVCTVERRGEPPSGCVFSAPRDEDFKKRMPSKLSVYPVMVIEISHRAGSCRAEQLLFGDGSSRPLSLVSRCCC